MNSLLGITSTNQYFLNKYNEPQFSSKPYTSVKKSDAFGL